MGPGGRVWLASAILPWTCALALSAAAAPAQRRHEDAQLRAAIGAQYETARLKALEPRVLQRSRGRARRQGHELILKLRRGRLALSNRPCSGPAETSCVAYSLVADLPMRHAYLVSVGLYEGGAFWLIDDRTGGKTTLPAPPWFSPDSASFITIDENEEGDAAGIEIWRRRGPAVTRLWRLPFGQDPVPHFSRVADWTRPDRIDLDFWCGPQTCPQLGPSAETHWRASLRRRAGRWRLRADWPTTPASGPAPGAASPPSPGA